MISIFTDRRYLPKNFVCHMLIPFWGQTLDVVDPDCHRFDDWNNVGSKYFKIVEDINDAQIAVYPASPTYNKIEFKEFQDKTDPLPLVVFFNDDFDGELEYRDNTYVFRTSFYKSSQKKSEFALPAWSNDYGKMSNRMWNKVPTVSFCGQVYPLDVRKKSLDVLDFKNGINTNFIRRDKFWGGWITQRTAELGAQVRKEFLDNMNNGDYILCARGGGNFSYRLYETMMSGRIPLFVNTDCVLPFDFEISWREYFPFVEKNDISNIDEILLDFHNSLSPDEFIERQNILRSVWEKYLSPVGFFSNLHKHWEE